MITGTKIMDDFGQFHVILDIAKNNFVPPMGDLTEFMVENEFSISKFLEKFSRQIDTNYSNLEKLELVNIKFYIIDLMKYLETICKFNLILQKVFTPDVIDFVKKIIDDIRIVKDTILDLSITLSEHSAIIRDILENNNISPIMLSVISRADYYEKHKEVLHKCFECEEHPEFPFSVPHVIELRDNLVTIKNEEEYKEMEKNFNYLKEKVNIFETQIPKTWPKLIPNLSTFNGEPLITVKNRDELLTVVSNYNRFLNRMSGLARGWSVLIRKLFEFNDLINQIFHQFLVQGIIENHIYKEEKF